MRFGNMRAAVLATTSILLATAGQARADYVNIAFLGAKISGAAVVTVSANSASVGRYTALTGTMDVLGDSSVRTGSLVANPNGSGVSFVSGATGFPGAFDDQLFLGFTTPVLDGNGLLFVSGVHDIFIYNNGGTANYDYLDYNTETRTFIAFGDLQLLVSAVQSGAPPAIPSLTVPEPSSLALCGFAGAVGLGMVARRRRSSRVAA